MKYKAIVFAFDFLHWTCTNIFRLLTGIVVFMAIILICVSNNNSSAIPLKLKFTDVTSQAGLDYQNGYANTVGTPGIIAGGVGAGDYDGDGWVDLYAERGDMGPNLLFRNRGDGTFEEVGAEAGVALSGIPGSGPTFADFDGDGWLDLFIGGIGGTKTSLYRNQGDGTFEDITRSSGLNITINTFSAAFGDYDLDGNLDLFITHWGTVVQEETTQHLWRNNGDGTFSDVSAEAGIAASYVGTTDFTFTPNFADINNDGRPDLLIAADFGTSKVFLNQGDGTFSNVTTDVISDENGMGAAVGDYDNDGDLDWFVSSILDPNGVVEGNWGITGNRLYNNRGNGRFEDVTDEAGVRHGFWGWGSCFADFNNDGHIDIFHVNGWPSPNGLEFNDDPSRLFISKGDGTFTEQATQLGLDDQGQGRGVVCFDYDRDGDIDIFITNNGQTPREHLIIIDENFTNISQGPRLYRNDFGNKLNNFLDLKLKGLPPNTEAIGARIYLTVGEHTQMRELQAGSNFVSQNPVEAHFGIGNSTVVDRIEIVWPDWEITTLQNIPANQFLVINHPRRP